MKLSEYLRDLCDTTKKDYAVKDMNFIRRDIIPKVEALEKDAERLDFVEQELEVNAGTPEVAGITYAKNTGWWFSDCYFEGTLREAIDAALALPEDEGGRCGEPNCNTCKWCHKRKAASGNWCAQQELLHHHDKGNEAMRTNFYYGGKGCAYEPFD